MNLLSKFFRLNEKPTEGIIQLLESVTLGTDGAHYKHLDTRERIGQLDHPLFLSLERNDKVIGNITFCRRGDDWYIRYFAFDTLVQSSGKKKSSGKSGGLRKELNAYFDAQLNGSGSEKVNSFYAYIDPRNAKSLWMSENFGFDVVGKLATQTFSRRSPKSSSRVEKIQDWNAISGVVEQFFSDHQYFFTDQTKKPPFYVLRNSDGKILACAKISLANWQIKRLPGKFGGVLVKLIPFIPIIRTLIQPDKHSFVVPEAVYVQDNDPNLFTELFEGILAQENKKLIFWWVDFNAPLYGSIRKKVKWGLLDKLLGVNEVNVVSKSIEKRSEASKKVLYTNGFDFI